MIRGFIKAVRQKYLELTVRSSINHDPGKERYYRIQRRQTIAKITKDARFRYELIVRRVLPFIPEDDRPLKKIVCVGCRNIYELREFKKYGFRDVKGVDLVSVHHDILIMDMHNLKFPNGSVDIVYSADSLEHAYDPALAVKNFLRVVRPNGFICLSVPIQWRKSLQREYVNLSDSADCQDFQSREQVLELFDSGNPRVLFEEMYKAPDGSNNWLAILRVNCKV